MGRGKHVWFLRVKTLKLRSTSSFANWISKVCTFLLVCLWKFNIEVCCLKSFRQKFIWGLRNLFVFFSQLATGKPKEMSRPWQAQRKCHNWPWITILDYRSFIEKGNIVEKWAIVANSLEYLKNAKNMLLWILTVSHWWPWHKNSQKKLIQ